MSPRDTSPDIATRFADWATRCTFTDLPPAVVEQARLSILDALGTALAAGTYDFAQTTVSAIAEMAGPGAFPVIGQPMRLPQRDAALANGMLAHALDYDDTHSEAVTHTTVSALPTALAAAQAAAADGKRLLTSFVVGSEAAARLGAAARGRFHDRGFHPTGVVGAFGACLCASTLGGLTAEQVRHAQGIALSMASGSLAFLDNGAWTKRLHPGWAAQAGISACALARHGVVGAAAPYEGRFGLYALYCADGPPVDVPAIVAGLGEDWAVLKIAFKPFPACHLAHAFADAALALRRTHNLQPSQIHAITAPAAVGIMPIVSLPQAEKQNPQSHYEAQFSIPYVVAASLVRGRFTLDELQDAARTDPQIQALCQKVHCVPDPDSAYPDAYSGALRIEMADGRVLEHREQVNRGAATRPLTRRDIEAKFRDNAALSLDAAGVERIIEIIGVLEQLPDMAPLLEALQPPAPG